MSFLLDSRFCWPREQVVAAILNASKGAPYYQKGLLGTAILMFYKQNNLFPDGLGPSNPSIQEWSSKMAEASARLAA